AWPDLTANATFLRFAEALARHIGFSLDTPFEELTTAQQHTILHGTGEAWIDLDSAENDRPEKGVRFQYKGLFPAIDEAARVSPAYRQRLDHLVSEVACATCNSSRLRDDAAACRLPFGADRPALTPGGLCALPLRETLNLFKSMQLTQG